MHSRAGLAATSPAGTITLTAAQALAITGGTGEAPGGWYIEVPIEPKVPTAPGPVGPRY